MPRPKRKRQTRLTFSPLTSSSPAASNYPAQIKERAAAVHYDNHGRPAKKSRLDGDSSSRAKLASPSSSSVIYSSPKAVVESPSEKASLYQQPPIFSRTALPTPAASSQTEDMERKENRKLTADGASSSEDDNVPMTPVSKRLFSHQTNAKPAGNDVFSDFSLPIAKAKPRVISGPSPVIFAGSQPKLGTGSVIDSEGSIAEHEKLVISSSDDESVQLEKRAKFLSSSRILGDMQTPPQTGPEPTRRGRPRRVISSRSSNSEMDQSLPKRKQSTESPTKTISSGPNSSVPRRLKTLGSDRLDLTMTKTSTSMFSKERQKKSANKAISDHQGTLTSDSDEVVTPARRRRPRHSSKADADDEDSDDIRGPVTTPRRRANPSKPSVIPVSDEDDSSSDDILTSPVRKGRLRRAAAPEKAPSPTVDDESLEDLQEDLEDLKQTEIRSERTRGAQRTPKKTKAQEQLELIRRRRAGENVAGRSDGLGPDHSPSRSKHALYDTTDNEDSSEEAEEYEEDDTHGNRPIRRGENLDEYEDDFVIEDEDDTLGAPTEITEMPFEFTRHAHRKPIEHFKDAVEWMVHNKLNPAFPREDASYQVAFRKLDDYVQGLAGSKFISSAWGGDFLKALKSRPEIAYLENTGMMELQHCAACNKSNHPAKFQLTFSGNPYARHTLEDLSSSDSDSDSSTQEPDPTFHVGRTCCANAETAHALHHWRHALNHWVIKHLADSNHTTPEKIVQREGWSTKRKSEYANRIVDGMEASGEMRLLHKEFKENLQAARDVRNERYSYGRRAGG